MALWPFQSKSMPHQQTEAAEREIAAHNPDPLDRAGEAIRSALESRGEHAKRVRIEAKELQVDDLTGIGPIKRYGEEDGEYENRLNNEVHEARQKLERGESPRKPNTLPGAFFRLFMPRFRIGRNLTEFTASLITWLFWVGFIFIYLPAQAINAVFHTHYFQPISHNQPVTEAVAGAAPSANAPIAPPVAPTSDVSQDQSASTSGNDVAASNIRTSEGVPQAPTEPTPTVAPPVVDEAARARTIVTSTNFYWDQSPDAGNIPYQRMVLRVDANYNNARDGDFAEGIVVQNGQVVSKCGRIQLSENGSFWCRAPVTSPGVYLFVLGVNGTPVAQNQFNIHQ